ncbi:MAG TPA: hypothetical protein VF821_22015 [Lentzea sp.]
MQLDVVVLMGLFSAKQKDFAEVMAAAAGELAARGTHVAEQVVQRRGVSHGGARLMSVPLSRRTLLSSGKVREVAQACQRTGADAVVIVSPSTEHQRRSLTAIFGRPALSLADALTR